MPRKGVNKHGTQEGQQTKTEFYKTAKNYKQLIPVNDDISKNLKSLYDNNIWDLKTKFEELKEEKNVRGNLTFIFKQSEKFKYSEVIEFLEGIDGIEDFAMSYCSLEEIFLRMVNSTGKTVP